MSLSDKPDALDAQSAQAGLDVYEAKYMVGDSATLFRSKARTTWQAPALAGATSLFILIWSATHGRPLSGLVLAAATALLGLFFAVLRVRVTPALVEIHHGLVGPKIPVESIESVESIVHPYRSPLRWGISPTTKGEWLYTIAGDQGRAVKIVWRTRGGRKRVHIIGSHGPEELVEAIRTAQRAAASAKEMLERK